MTRELYWDECSIGDACETHEYEVTEARVMAYADLTGDHTPVHTDEDYARSHLMTAHRGDHRGEGDQHHQEKRHVRAGHEDFAPT